MMGKQESITPSMEIISQRLELISEVAELPMTWKVGRNINVTLRLPERFHRHCSEFCEKVKDSAGSDAPCIYNDQVIVGKTALSKKKNFLNVCHAGASEWIIPLFYGDSYVATLLIGPFRTGNEVIAKIPQNLRKEFKLLPIVRQKKLEYLSRLVELVIVPLLPHISTEYPEPLLQTPQFSVMPPDIQIAMEYAKKHFRSQISIKKVAALCRTSVSRFQHIFRRHIGYPYMEYVLRVRLQEAEHLLLYTDISVAQIATGCNLTDQSRLTRLFRRFYGTTPAKLRRNSTSAVAQSTILH